jgi:PadR family transcriptional regulator PadR
MGFTYLAPQGTVCGMADAAPLSTSLRRGTLEFCVLALVEREDRYGNELVRRLGDEPNLAASEGTIYPLLSRLRRVGWLDSKWAESPSGPPRRYYGLTPAGRAALEHFRTEWVSFRQTVDRLVGTGEVA